jgi:outer membrane protein insertion porin family
MKNLTTVLAAVLLSIVLLNDQTLAEKSRKPKVRSVTFVGNTTYPATRLEGLMLTRPSRFLATSRFHPEVFRDDLETLTAFYKQSGFLQARVLDTLVSVDSIANCVDVSIRFDEGARTFVEGVTVFGNQFFADSVLMRHVGIQNEDPLRRPVIEDAVVALLYLYAEHGYLDASVTPKVLVNDTIHRALVDFAVHEGVRSCVGSINKVGAEKTRSNVIERELGFQQGDTIRYSTLIDSQRRLYFTGLFESVFVRPVPAASGDSAEREIRIEVKEKPSSELSFSIGYGTVEKVRGRIELNTSNLAGTARKAGIGLEANFIKQGVTLSFSEPWTLGTRWKTDLTMFGRLQQEPAYHAEVIGGIVTVGRKLDLHTMFSLSYRLENTNLSQVDLSVPVEEMDPHIRSLTVSLNHDTRDNLFDPIRGWYANWSNEIAGSFLQGSSTFARSVLTLKQFCPLGRKAVLGSSLELGWMDSFGDKEEVPISERFYAGGPTSLRGFGYQMVGPMDTIGEPFGGQVKVVWNVLELRQSIFRMFGGALFIDVGNVWSRPETVKLTDLRVNSGAGLRVNSPLGILRLDCGINLDRRAEEPGVKVFVSMGQAF